MLVFYEVGRGSEEGLHLSEGNKSPSVVSVDQRQTLSERDAPSVCSWLPKKKNSISDYLQNILQGEIALHSFCWLCSSHCAFFFLTVFSLSNTVCLKALCQISNDFFGGHLWKRRNFISFISCATAVFFFFLSGYHTLQERIQTFKHSFLKRLLGGILWKGLTF